MTADEVAKTAAQDIAGRIDAQVKPLAAVAFDPGTLIQEATTLLTQLGNYLPAALTFLRTLAAIWGGSKTGS